MAGALSIAALILSATLLAGVIAVLVLLRKGEGPRHGVSRVYDENRRDAVRALTGEEVDRVDSAQWFEPARRHATPDDPVAAPYGGAVAEALAAVVPPERGLALEPDGRARLPAEDVTVLPALSTADLLLGLERHGDAGRLVVGLVLFNPEPPGGDAKRVALPVQVLFPALERAGRGDLVARFAELKERAASPPPA
jgi:hypothetical protein